MPNFIQASKYVVYVPSNQVGFFEKITDPRISVAAQESLDTGFYRAVQDAVVANGNPERFGWYLQQFLKIQALFDADESGVAIWDADCVPVRPLSLFDENGVPNFMVGEEYNEDYFVMIKKLTGLSRTQKHSFVTPGFPMLSSWLDDFKHQLESSPPRSLWWEKIVDATNFSLKGGFSETETLGTWVLGSYEEEWTLYKPRWERLGQSRFGYARSFSPEDLVRLGAAHELDVVSFENWDLRGFRRIGRRLGRMASSIVGR